MPLPPVVAFAAPDDRLVTPQQVAEVIARACPAEAFRGTRVLVIVPDGTRTAPVGLLFKTLHAVIGEATAKLDVMIALGTHQPMSEDAICQRLEIPPAERHVRYQRVQFFNHEWDNPAALKEIGVISADEVAKLTDGLFAMDVPVEINKRVFDYDRIIIIGPVFPHEVIGFSGGNKYLFPGVAGPRILNFFHWLGAVVTNPMIIGNKWTPVRRVVDRAGAMVAVDRLCFCLVVAPDKSLAGLFAGTPEGAWDAASELSRQVHITRRPRPFHTILSCCPPMYADLWTGGKCMYKLEPVLADGGELIIYAPHIREISVTHDRTIREIGYHCRDYFLKQWDRCKHHPWGVIAHSTHVRGLGTFEHGVEACRAQVTLASQIPESVCRQINLGYRDPKSVRVEDYAHREPEGVLHVAKAGELLFHLEQPPKWAGETEHGSRRFRHMGDFKEFSLTVRLFLKAYPWRRLDPVPWTPLPKPLAQCKLALVSSAGFVLPGQPRFDEQVKGGDPSFREIPGDVDVKSFIDTHRSESFDHTGLHEDPNLAFPIDRVRELAARGRVGAINRRHLSFMGSLTVPGRFVRDHVPQAAGWLTEDGVDVALLVPV